MARKRKRTQSSVEHPDSRATLPDGITLEQQLCTAPKIYQPRLVSRWPIAGRGNGDRTCDVVD
jgi:hypothetical protein